MIKYFLLLCVVIGCSAQSILQKQFNKNYLNVGKANYLYNFFMTFFAFLSFAIIFAISPKVNLSSLPYSLGVAVTICMSIVFNFLAIKEGPLALTSLVVSFSLLIPTFYGVIFCDEKLSVLGIIGIVFLIISLILVSDYSKTDNKITKKYLLFLFLAALGNGLCSTFQKMHQMKFDGNFGGFFMFVAMFSVAIFNFIMLLKNKPQNESKIFQKGTVLASATGICNGLVNYLMIVLVTKLQSFILYPTVSAGSTLAVFLISLIFYKERVKLYQYFGYGFGFVAIIFLNL